MTTLEADHAHIHPARIMGVPPAEGWGRVLSRIDVHDVTREIADQAASLLRSHRLHGHKYAIDTVLAAAARTAPGPVTVLTSDPEDLTLFCGSGIEVIKA